MATGSDHYRRAEELLARDGPLTGEMLAAAQVHAMLALAAATALVGRDVSRSPTGRPRCSSWTPMQPPEARPPAAACACIPVACQHRWMCPSRMPT
jgi:hypothetical protein